MESKRKYKILVSFTNTNKIGGPNNAMKKLMNSYLSEKYEFKEIIINEHLGKILNLSLIKRLIKYIKNEKPDIIYFTGLQLHGFYFAISALFSGYKRKTIMVVRGSSCDSINISKYKKMIFKFFIEPLTVRITEVVHTVCLQMANNTIIKNNVKNFGGVIYNTIPMIKEKYNYRVTRDKLQLNVNDIILIYTGRIVKDKGIDYLLEAFALIKNNNIKLLLAGDGEDLIYFKKLCLKLNIYNKVKFLGNITNTLEVLNASDIFVFPTLHENLSNSLLEACAIGLPVIATNVGGNIEVIRENIDGILINPGNINEIKNAIEMLINDKEKRMIMGENSKKHVNEVFAPKNVYKKLDLLFEQIIKNDK